MEVPWEAHNFSDNRESHILAYTLISIHQLMPVYYQIYHTSHLKYKHELTIRNV